MSFGRIGGVGSVPKFQKIKSVQELQPRINSQPPFRRANPEGGFISVRNSRWILFALLTFAVAAASSLDNTFAFDVSNMQPNLQVRIVQKPTQGSHETEQRRQKRRL
jgi:dual specificity protein kinase YAK1